MTRKSPYEIVHTYGKGNGFTFMAGHWVVTGPESFDVAIDVNGRYGVFSTSVAGSRLLYPGFTYATQKEAEAFAELLWHGKSTLDGS